ncbi:MAG TPA: hypothetical protein VFE30_11905 [Anaeromyxobacteraceae bacterium]|jgi:hypothetical protein|nr:hypothetical protein [Anaeromyxobacteraceae bacterium]
MAPHRPRSRLAAVALALSALAFAPALALAEGLSIYAEPDYSHIDTRTTDSQGHTTTSVTDELLQRYNLTLTKTLAPLVRFDANGNFEDDRQWSTTAGLRGRSDGWRASGSARLHLGPPVLGGDLSYSRQDESTESSLSPGRLHDINEVYSLHLGWHPADLPDLDTRASRTNTFDVSRKLSDTTIDDLLTTLSYTGIRQLTLQYTVEYQDTNDRLSGTTTSGLLNSGRVSYGDTFNHGRTAVQASYSFANRLADTSVTGLGGTVATQQLPAAGLSLVEPPTAVPETDTLTSNGLLVDGKTDLSANVNLGFSVSLAGDTSPRELGVQFSDPTTSLNTLYVYVQQQLPPQISGAFAWSAWRSDDNVTWTRVPLTTAVVFNALLNRFELTFDRIQAPYVKVVTRPLPAAVSTDRRWSDVFVTELQAYLVVAAEAVRGHSSITAQSAAVAVRQQLLEEPLLTYDFSGNFSYSGGNGAFAVQNGLSLDKLLAPYLKLSSRVARQDTGIRGAAGGSQHNGSWQYSSSLVATPLPTLTHALTYSGQLTQTAHGDAELNSLTLVNRAALYRGVDLLLSTGYAYNLLESGAIARGPTVITTLAVSPNPVVSLSTSFNYAALRQSGGGLPESNQETERVDGALSVNPLPALYLSAAVQRVVKGARPTTLATFSGGFTPFPEGALLLRMSYTESLDTALDSKTHVANSGLRWNFSPRAYLDLNYSLLGSTAPTGTTDTRAFTAGLAIQL